MTPEGGKSASSTERVRFRVKGLVQGVGFRPFVYRLAASLELAGHVSNNSEGVTIEIEGASSTIAQFHRRLLNELPAISRITACTPESIPPQGGSGFSILVSEAGVGAHTQISPDIATCDDCLHELLDPNDRRIRYPFINCTNCGPRYTIVERIPYDRPSTSMKVFPMCASCQKEYDSPLDRRFHAQPNACPVCGPKVTLRNADGKPCEEEPIVEAIRLLQEGKILAIRGVGGFHLAVDPHNESALAELRQRKGRAEKPFALMARNLETIRRYCLVSVDEEQALCDRTRQIVLLKKNPSTALPNGIASGQHSLGVMLPYTPLHHLLLAGELDLLVMTSGNFSEEPIAIGDSEAQERLESLADYFLVHDREILQRCDDSIVRVMAGKRRVVRRSRGFVPDPVFLATPTARKILAVGGELKNTIALSRDNAVFLSQHIGDLDNPSAFRFFQDSIRHLEAILEITPELIVHDLHPEYLSTKWARTQAALPTVAVQHHHAHLAAVLAENGVDEPCIGIVLDGTGYGTDGTIWGGEILVGNAVQFERVSWLEPVPMPGGEAAIKQPWRMGLSYLKHAFGSDLQSLDLPFLQNLNGRNQEIALLAIDRGLNSPLTSSCGRLFDGVAAILGLRGEVNFEAQAAMELEAISADPAKSSAFLEPIETAAKLGPISISPLVRALVTDLQKGVTIPDVAARFHVTLAELLIAQAKLARKKYALAKVALSGGVYQNLLFFEYLVRRLNEEQFTVLTHTQVPTNDGGLALGQIAVADALIRAGKIS
jgi:hydrogenase maturation protein HypF